VIDLRDASGAERIGDAPEVTFARIAGVDQQRLAGRADEERRLPTLGIDVVDRQRSGSALCGRAQHGSHRTPHRDHDSAHP
jgi:hypothetical protein